MIPLDIRILVALDSTSLPYDFIMIIPAIKATPNFLAQLEADYHTLTDLLGIPDFESCVPVLLRRDVDVLKVRGSGLLTW